MRLIGVIALLLWSMTMAIAAEQDESGDECSSLGGTLQEAAVWLKGNVDEKAGIRAVSCHVDDPLFGQSRFDLVLHADRIYDIGQKIKTRYGGTLIESFERPLCPGGRIVINGSPIVVRGNQARVLEPMSGAMGTSMKMQWVSETLLGWPMQSHTSFEAALAAKPIGTCTFGDEFGRWYDHQVYGQRPARAR